MPSSTRSLSASGSGQARPAAARRSSVRATVLRAMPSDRAIARSLDPQACFRRRISRTRRIDTLSAGIGSPTRHWSVTNRSPLTRPATERPPPDGWPTSNRDGRHHVGAGGRLHLGIGGRLAPESAVPHETAASLAKTYGPPRPQAAFAIRLDQSASTYPVSGSSPGRDGGPRARVLIKASA